MIFMGILTKDLKMIRGYEYINNAGDVYKYYEIDDNESLKSKNVLDSIIRCLDILNKVIYQDVDISSELESLRHPLYARNLRQAIYNAIKKLANAAGINLGIPLAHIKTAHFGTDIREPLYEALIKLGAEGDMYYQTTAEDYIWRKESDSVILVRYIGGSYPYIITPQTIDDSPVTEISSFAFDSHTELMGVRIPSGTITI